MAINDDSIENLADAINNLADKLGDISDKKGSFGGAASAGGFGGGNVRMRDPKVDSWTGAASAIGLGRLTGLLSPLTAAISAVVFGLSKLSGAFLQGAAKDKYEAVKGKTLRDVASIAEEAHLAGAPLSREQLAALTLSTENERDRIFQTGREIEDILGTGAFGARAFGIDQEARNLTRYMQDAYINPSKATGDASTYWNRLWNGAEN